MIRSRLRLFLVPSICIASSLLLCAPTTLAASCCKCKPSGDAAKTSCMTIAKDGFDATTQCPTLATVYPANAQLKSLTCEKIECETVKKISDGGTCYSVDTPETFGASASGPTVTNMAPVVAPNLGVKIPGLSFSSNLPVVGGRMQIPYLADYIGAVYKYLVGISVIAAALMMIFGGFKYILGSTFTTISSGKKSITDALMGLLLILGSYTLLNALNPVLLKPGVLDVYVVTPEDTQISVIPISDFGKLLSAGSGPQGAPAGPSVELKPGGTLVNGECTFQLNQAAIPTADSIFECAVKVSKSIGINPCYLATVLNRETSMVMPNSISHDENANNKWADRKLADDSPSPNPTRIKFLTDAQIFSNYIKSPQGPKFTVTDPWIENKTMNDDYADFSKSDLGLDPRYAHGGGLTQITVAADDCGDNFDKIQRFQPYYSIYYAAQFIHCVLKNGDALKSEDQELPSTISTVWQIYGGCPHVPCRITKAKTPLRSFAQGPVTETVKCMGEVNPAKYIRASSLKLGTGSAISICRGDLPLDRAACREAVSRMEGYGTLSPEKVCNTSCADKGKMPVLCDASETVCGLNPDMGKVKS